jgi:hypothetical protein
VRTKLDEIVEEEARRTLVSANGWTASARNEFLSLASRVAVRVFRHGVEQACEKMFGQPGRVSGVQPAPAEDSIKRCIHGQAIHCDKGCHKAPAEEKKWTHADCPGCRWCLGGPRSSNNVEWDRRKAERRKGDEFRFRPPDDVWRWFLSERKPASAEACHIDRRRKDRRK